MQEEGGHTAGGVRRTSFAWPYRKLQPSLRVAFQSILSVRPTAPDRNFPVPCQGARPHVFAVGSEAHGRLPNRN